MTEKVVICKGEAHTPARFWSWAVCSVAEFTGTLKEQGWATSQCTNHLTEHQLAFLNQSSK